MAERRDTGGTAQLQAALTQARLERHEAKRQLAEARAALEAAERRIKAAESAKAVFLATVSHELRTPLNAILGFSDLMAMEIAGSLNAEQIDYLNHIKNSSMLLLGTIDRMLDLVRLSTAQPQLTLVRVQVSALLRRAWDELEGLRRGEMRVVPNWQVDESEPRIVADVEALRRVFLAIFDNADKFSPIGGTVTVSVTATPERLSIGIVDRGVGIAEADAAMLMRPFVQLDDSLHRRFEGSGLGLSIAAALIHAHGGELSLAPGPGGIGTAVTVVLPHESDRQSLTAGDAR